MLLMESNVAPREGGKTVQLSGKVSGGSVLKRSVSVGFHGQSLKNSGPNTSRKFDVRLHGKSINESSLRITMRKVRGVKDESDEFIRLADAIAGFVRDVIEGDETMQNLFKKAISNGVLKEV